MNANQETPPAGARDAVCDYGSLAHRLYCAIACNGDSACIFGADPVVRERWLSGVEEVLGKATQPAAPRNRHPLAHRERMCERVSTNPEPQPAATGAGEPESVAGDVMFGWRLAASSVCEKDARRAAEEYARKKVAP